MAEGQKRKTLNKISTSCEHIVYWMCRKCSYLYKYTCQVRTATRNFKTEIWWVRITYFNQGQLSNTRICSWSSQKLEIDSAVCDKIERTSCALIWSCQNDLTCQRFHNLWQIKRDVFTVHTSDILSCVASNSSRLHL